MVVGFATSSVLALGCRSCRNEHPFVPYRIEAGSTAAEGSSSADATSPGKRDAGALHELAEVAPANATTWTLGKLSLVAPSGGLFRRGLTWDVDGDGLDDAFALVQETDERVREELYFYQGVAEGAPSGARVSLGEPLSIDPRCARIEHLVRTGARSVAVEVGEACDHDAGGPGVDRVVALVAWSSGLKTRLLLPVADPPGSGALRLEIDGSDIDGDGLDDATLRVTLDPGEPPFEPAPPVSALFRWLDRPAGLSREPGEPDHGFHALAASATSRASRAKEASSALPIARSGRALFAAVCAESSVRRVAPAPEASLLSCEAGRSLEELGLAAARAYAMEGDVLRAIAQLDAATSAPATRTPARLGEALSLLGAAAPTVQATALRAIAAVPRLGPLGASWGALRFEPSGTLLVRTLTGVVRVDPATGVESDAGVAPWDTAVVSPDGKLRFEGAWEPCSFTHAMAIDVSFVDAVDGGAPSVAVPVPVVAPISRRCTSAGAAREASPSLPIAWGPGGFELVVQGEPVVVNESHHAAPLVRLEGQPVTPGSPRSPDGKTFVVPTSQGVVERGVKTRLLRARELEHGYGELRDCTVSDDGARVACVRGGVAFFGIWPPP